MVWGPGRSYISPVASCVHVHPDQFEPHYYTLLTTCILMCIAKLELSHNIMLNQHLCLLTLLNVGLSRYARAIHLCYLEWFIFYSPVGKPSQCLLKAHLQCPLRARLQCPLRARVQCPLRTLLQCPLRARWPV